MHGTPPAASILATLWTDTLTSQLLGLLWDAYDAVLHAAWSKVDWTQDYDDLERSLSEDLAQAINERMDSYMPVHVLHGASERESRAVPPAQPPEYDIAFRWNENPLFMWPIEAKVLKSDRDTQENLKDYIDTVQQRYLTGYYAPFSTGGAMLAYLKSGDAETVVAHIGARLRVSMGPHPVFSGRCHKISDHQRSIPTGKDYPITFRLHHLMIQLSPTAH